MSHYVSYFDFTDNPFTAMAVMCVITVTVALFDLTHAASELVPFFQLAALSMTIYVGYRTITKQKNKPNGKKTD